MMLALQLTIYQNGLISYPRASCMRATYLRLMHHYNAAFLYDRYHLFRARTRG